MASGSIIVLCLKCCRAPEAGPRWVAVAVPPLKTAVALTELGRTEKRMLEKIAVCGREIVTWTAGSRRKGCRGRGHIGLIRACAEE